MLKPRALRVRALTGVSVSTSVVPGVMRARTLARKSGAIVTRCASSLRFGPRPPLLAMENPIPPPARVHRRQRGISVRTRQPLEAADQAASGASQVPLDVVLSDQLR